MDPETVALICRIAMSSSIASYPWKNRGKAPPGYTKGMAVAFGRVLVKWLQEDPTALDVSIANTHEPDTDALSWYAGIFNDLGMLNDRPGVDTLRHVFVLLMGLGMRESSGKYCEGRDMSASNVTADTAEAGLFQMSWNMRSCSPNMQRLMDEYSSRPPACYLDIFKEGVTCSTASWKSYGSGAGYNYQELAKHCPQFAVETTAVGLRKRRKHWGPINRYDVEVKKEADDMFKQVQDIIMQPAIPPSETPTVSITTTGKITLTVNGKVV